MSDLIIRVGTPKDIERIMLMADCGARENGQVPHDMNRILHEFWPALHLDGGIVGIVGPKDGEPEGCILLKVTKFWYGFDNGDDARPILEERWLFVSPEYRAGKVGRARKLCEFAKTTAERMGLPLMIGILSTIRLDAKVRLYERVFGKPTGMCWYIEPPSAEQRAAPDEPVHASA